MHSIGDQFGVNTYSYTQAMSAADCLRHLADRGVGTFELMFFPAHVWITDSPKSFKEIRGIISSNRLELVSTNSPNIDLNIAAATGEMRALSLEINRAYLRIAAELGAAGLVLGPGKANPLFPLPASVLNGHFFKALDKLVPLADELGVELLVENMPFAFLPSASDVMASLEQYGADQIRVCYDVANAHFVGEDPATGLQTVASRLALVHASDTTRSVYRHDAVGAGDVDFARLPEAIAAARYRRPVVLEIISTNADTDIGNSADALRGAGFRMPG